MPSLVAQKMTPKGCTRQKELNTQFSGQGSFQPARIVPSLLYWRQETGPGFDCKWFGRFGTTGDQQPQCGIHFLFIRLRTYFARQAGAVES